MARKTKDALIDEARELELEVDEEMHYNEIFELVKEARESSEEEPEDDDGDEEVVRGFDRVEVLEGTAESVFEEPAPEVPAPRQREGWNSLGVWVGRGSPK